MTDLLLLIVNVVLGWIAVKIRRLEKVYYTVFGTNDGDKGLVHDVADAKDTADVNRDMLIYAGFTPDDSFKHRNENGYPPYTGRTSDMAGDETHPLNRERSNEDEPP